jgi:hypothetical protein
MVVVVVVVVGGWEFDSAGETLGLSFELDCKSQNMRGEGRIPAENSLKQ